MKYTKYTFFWKGPLSQWKKSLFHGDGIQFCTAEQYMMYSKAVLFNDKETADKILRTTDPKEQQLLGREVKNFELALWELHARDIVYRGNYFKFSQNSELKKILCDTADTLLVEASPFDKIWGIGLDEETAKQTPFEQWPGRNWLGQVLTNLRDDMLGSLNDLYHEE